MIVSLTESIQQRNSPRQKRYGNVLEHIMAEHQIIPVPNWAFEIEQVLPPNIRCYSMVDGPGGDIDAKGLNISLAQGHYKKANTASDVQKSPGPDAEGRDLISNFIKIVLL